MKRQIVGVAFACLALASCAGDVPTSPDTSLPEGVPTALTLSVDRKTLPAEGLAAEVNVTIAVAVQAGTRPDLVPVQVVVTIDGVDEPLEDTPRTGPDGRITRVYNLPASATIAASTGGLSKSVRITRAEPDAIPEPPINPPDDDDDDDDWPPAPVPRLFVSLTASETSVETGDSITFTAVASATGGAAAVTSYEWDLDGDGEYDDGSNLAEIDHVYATADTYSVRVQVSNDSEAATSAAVTVTVTQPELPELFVDLTVSPGPYNTTDDVTLTATVTAEDDNVPDGLSFNWDFNGDGATDDADNDIDGGVLTIDRGFSSTGNQTIRVTVTDPATGRTATTTRTITVQ